MARAFGHELGGQGGQTARLKAVRLRPHLFGSGQSVACRSLTGSGIRPLFYLFGAIRLGTRLAIGPPCRTTTADPTALGSLIQEQVRALDTNLPVFDLRTVVSQIDESLVLERMVAALFKTAS